MTLAAPERHSATLDFCSDAPILECLASTTNHSGNSIKLLMWLSLQAQNEKTGKPQMLLCYCSMLKGNSIMIQFQ